jgi:hypoxanthine phosphoribosyltransferase
MMDAKIMTQAALKYDADAIKAGILSVATQLQARFNFHQTKFVAICVLDGAMNFYTDLTRCIPANFETRSIQVSRFHGGTLGGVIEWVKRPNFNLEGRSVLIIDELCDEGVSLAFVKEECFKLGAKEAYTVALVNKKLDRPEGLNPDFFGIEYDGKDFLGGYGLDLSHGARNTNSIWTVPKELASEVPVGFYETQSAFFETN